MYVDASMGYCHETVDIHTLSEMAQLSSNEFIVVSMGRHTQYSFLSFVVEHVICVVFKGEVEMSHTISVERNCLLFSVARHRHSINCFHIFVSGLVCSIIMLSISCIMSPERINSSCFVSLAVAAAAVVVIAQRCKRCEWNNAKSQRANILTGAAVAARVSQIKSFLLLHFCERVKNTEENKPTT